MNLAGEYSGREKAYSSDVEGVILAAGFSKRAGAFKLTLDLCGKTILARCIEGMYNHCSRLIVVGGHRAADLLPIVERYPRAGLVLNENYQDGMFSSVRKGLEYVSHGRFFLTPGDYPLISPDVYEKMLKTDADIVVPSYSGECGHPVLIKSNLAKVISGSGYCCLKDFIDSKGYTEIMVQDRGILMDVDTTEDFQRIQREYIYGE